jgi:hypothetical protein
MPEVGKDLEFSDDGDVLIDGTGDLQLADTPRTVIQDIQFRVQNNYDDFNPDPLLAADLQRFRGRPNNRQTGDSIKESVYYSLIRDGRFRRGDVFVDVVPYSKQAVAIFVFVMAYVEDLQNRVNRNPYDQLNLVVQFSFNLDIGLITRITDVKE